MEVHSKLIAYSIGQPMWDLNTRYIHAIAESLVQDETEIVGVIVRDTKKQVVEAIGYLQVDNQHFKITSPIYYGHFYQPDFRLSLA